MRYFGLFAGALSARNGELHSFLLLRPCVGLNLDAVQPQLKLVECGLKCLDLPREGGLSKASISALRDFASSTSFRATVLNSDMRRLLLVACGETIKRVQAPPTERRNAGDVWPW